MDPGRRDYVLLNGESYCRTRVGPSWALERCPAEIALALAAV